MTTSRRASTKEPQNIPPHSPEAEIAVLGAALQDAEALRLMREGLRPSDFFTTAHSAIAEACGSVCARGLVVDIRSVGELLHEQGRLAGVGGGSYLFSLVEQVPTAANAAHYVQIVREKAQLRRLYDACTRAAERARTNGTCPGDITADLWEDIRDLERLPGKAGAVLVRLSDVSPEAITWLWEGRIAAGKMSLLVGDPGLGKSYLTMDLAARVTIGGTWPDKSPARPGTVIVLTAEDGLADTVRPRLDLLGGDPARVHILTGTGDPEKPSSFTLAQDLDCLEDAVLRTGAGLVIIDPLSAYLGSERDSHRDADVRGLLAPLAALAERHQLAVLSVLHLNKSEQQKALYRVQGTLAFVAASRAVFAVVNDQDEPGRRLFLPLKMNLGPTPPTLGFRIDARGLWWEAGPVEVDIESALGGWEAKAERSERQEAGAFLREVLADGSVPAEEVKKQAKAAGMSEATLRRAKGELGITHYKVGYPGVWMWATKPKVFTGDT